MPVAGLGRNKLSIPRGQPVRINPTSNMKAVQPIKISDSDLQQDEESFEEGGKAGHRGQARPNTT